MGKFVIAVPIVSYALFEREAEDHEGAVEMLRLEIEQGMEPEFNMNEVRVERLEHPHYNTPWAVRAEGTLMFHKAEHMSDQRDGEYWAISSFMDI